MRLARADPGDVPDRSGPGRGDGLERLGRIAEVLEVSAEDTGRLHHRQHPACLLGGPAQRLRAQDGLARRSGETDGFLVQEVGQRDDDDVRVGVLDRGPQVRGGLGDGPASLERGAAILAARVDDADPIAAALAVEGVRVEVADEPGAEHRDTVAVHGCPPPSRYRGDGPARGRDRRPGPRAWRVSPSGRSD